jgi:hypothetical protein
MHQASEWKTIRVRSEDMSVIFGIDFPDVVMLDVDAWPSSTIDDLARKVSDRFRLGDCLIVASSIREAEPYPIVHYHLIFDVIMPWSCIHELMRQLARESVVDKNLTHLQKARGDFTTRLSPDRANGRMMPFPIGYVRGSTIRGGRFGDRHAGGIKKWLEAWKIAKNISRISFNSPQAPRIAQK